MAGDGRLPSAEARHAVVVGCGPVGSLMAIYLARLGWRVSVFEKRPDYAARVAAGGIFQRAYDIFLGPRGLGAIREAGAEVAPDVSVDLEGLALHGAKPGRVTKLKFFVPQTAIHRDVLGNVLQEQGAKAFPSQIDYNFDHKFVGADFDAKVANFEAASSKEVVSRRYDLLVGADGCWSGVRGEMARAGFLTFEQRRNAGGGIMLGDYSLPGAEEDWDRHWHLWMQHMPSMIMAATPVPGGGYRLGIGSMHDMRSANVLDVKSEEELEAFLLDKYPDLFAGGRLPEGLARSFMAQEPNHNGVETRCSAFHGGDGVVLVGDAAHSVWPNQGQGCNAGLESCKVLAAAIEEHGGDLSKALPAFTAVRKPDTDMLGVISRRPLFGVWAIVKQQLMVTLHKVMPFLIKESAYVQVLKGELRYSSFPSLERWQNGQLAMLLAGVVGLTTFALKKK